MKNNQDSPLLKQIKDRRKRGWNKELLFTLSYLALPAFLVSLLIFLIPYSFFLSMIPIYFILPMFYTVEKRFRYALTGIGKKDFSYKDGYHDFFKGRSGGLFGVIMSLLYSFSFYLLSDFILANFIGYIFSAFPESLPVYEEITKVISGSTLGSEQLITIIINNLAELYRPLSIFVSLTFFIPIVVILFFSIPNNLTCHYLATIVLPDIDNNISASQARSLAKYTLIRPINKKRHQLQLAYNWPYLLAFTVIYGLSTYLFTLTTISVPGAVPFLVFLTPALSIFYGSYLSYMTIYNDYAITEELSSTLLNHLPDSIKASIYQAYTNPEYRHGEESAMRGCFVPNPNNYSTFYASANDIQTKDETIEAETKEDTPETKPIFDFSHLNDKENKDDKNSPSK